MERTVELSIVQRVVVVFGDGDTQTCVGWINRQFVADCQNRVGFKRVHYHKRIIRCKAGFRLSVYIFDFLVNEAVGQGGSWGGHCPYQGTYCQCRRYREEIFLYMISKCHCMLVIYNSFNAFLINSSTVREASSFKILSNTFSAGFFAKPSATKADNASALLLL